jgi:hypothetical protein
MVFKNSPLAGRPFCTDKAGRVGNFDRFYLVLSVKILTYFLIHQPVQLAHEFSATSIGPPF